MATTTQLARPLTYDDLRQMPDDVKRYEIINEDLLVSPAPSLAHQIVAANIYDTINAYVRRHHLGRVLFAPIDVWLSPFDVVEPDLLFLRHDRLDALKEGRLIDGPPELVVEIIAQSSASIDPIRKAALYARAGVPEYWLADPGTTAFRMLVRGDDGTYRDTKPAESRLHSTVIKGLIIDPAALFADLA